MKLQSFFGGSAEIARRLNGDPTRINKKQVPNMRKVSNWKARLPTKRRKPPAAAESFPHQSSPTNNHRSLKLFIDEFFYFIGMI